MPNIQIAVNGRSYDVTCDAGQEDRLRLLARGIDERVATLARSLGQVGDARLLLMASLFIADDLAEARGENERLRAVDLPARRAMEERLVSAIEGLARRIETIAAQLEAA